jgi:hypothetical protein
MGLEQIGKKNPSDKIVRRTGLVRKNEDNSLKAGKAF